MFTVYGKDTGETQISAAPLGTLADAERACADLGTPLLIKRAGRLVKCWYPWHAGRG